MSESSPSKVNLSDDQRAVLARHVKEISQNLHSLLFLLDSEGGLPADAARSVLSLSEYRHSDIGKILGVETQSDADIEKRSADIRRANLRVRELEGMLGDAQDPKAIQMCLKVLFERLNSWWKLEGFGHISEISFGEYNCRVKFSCHLFGDFSVVQSETPVSDKTRRQQWYESLAERGFVIRKEGSEKNLEDSQANRQVLKDLFTQRMPSSRIYQFESHEGQFSQIRDVHVVIHKIGDILDLPQLPKGAEE